MKIDSFPERIISRPESTSRSVELFETRMLVCEISKRRKRIESYLVRENKLVLLTIETSASVRGLRCIGIDETGKSRDRRDLTGRIGEHRRVGERETALWERSTISYRRDWLIKLD
jgi:hypothetical protein